VTDTWALAKKKHPGQKNSLDALCKRYDVDNSNRQLHGALLDAQLLAEVYLALTGGQEALALHSASDGEGQSLPAAVQALIEEAKDRPLPVIAASADECSHHEARLGEIEKRAGHCLWPRAVS